MQQHVTPKSIHRIIFIARDEHGNVATGATEDEAKKHLRLRKNCDTVQND